VVGCIKLHYCKLSTDCASEKNFENRSIIGEDINKSKVARFLLAHPVVSIVLVDELLMRVLRAVVIYIKQRVSC